MVRIITWKGISYVPHRDVLDSFVCFERWEPSTPEIFQKPYIIQFDIAILEYRNRFLEEVILYVVCDVLLTSVQTGTTNRKYKW